MSQDVSLKMTELDRLTSLPHMQLVKAALPYIHIPEQRFFSLFVKFRELEKTMQLFADPADGEIGICSVGERDKDSPVDMLKAIKPYGTEEEQSSIDLVLNFIEGSRLYESYWQNMPQTASFPTSQDIQNDSPNSDAVPASVLYPQARYSRRQKEPTDRASGHIHFKQTGGTHYGISKLETGSETSLHGSRQNKTDGTVSRSGKKHTARQASAASHESPGQQRFPAILNLRNGHSFFDPDRPNAPSAETAGGNAADAEPADGRGK